ncbi:hypothetical protein GCM10028798_29480 [Humibacter antri]
MLPITDVSDAGRMLRDARLDAALTQRGLAELSGVQQSHIAAIESGKRAVSAELLTRLLRAAGYRPSLPLEREADRIVGLAAERGLGNVRVFGSAVRGEDGFDSDVDLLVDIENAEVPFGLPSFVSRAEEVLRFPVDVVVDREGGFADRVRAEAVTL